MKSKLLSSSVAILSLSLVVAACGDDTTAPGGGGSGGDGASGGSGGSGGGAGLQGPGGGPTVGGGGSGGAPGDGNDSFAEAQDMDEQDGVFFVDTEELEPAQTDIDYYKFTAAAGAYAIFAAAKPEEDGFAPGYLDTVISIYNSAEQKVAGNDDPYPRNSQDSSVYTILEAGDYFIKIEEFCNEADCGAEEEAYYDDLTETEYSLFAVALDGADNGTVSEGAEPNSTAANATVMEYEPTTDDPNLFFLSTCIGDWTNAADVVDGILFSAPANVTVDAASRPSGRIIIPPPGTNGSGSSANPGIIEVVDTTTMTTLAKFNMGAEDDSPNRAELTFPITLGPTQEYLIRVADGPAATGGETPFYFLFHGVGGGNPVETAEATNSVIATPEALTGMPNGELTSSFIEGDIPDMDVDFFELNVTDDTFTVTCEALRGGSGATLRVEVLSGDGMTSLGTDIESATAGAMNQGALLIEDADTSGETTVIVKIDKTAQAADVTGSFYRCGFHFAAPDMP